MGATLRGLAWFVASLGVACVVLWATVFDVWLVERDGALVREGDLVLVRREAKLRPGDPVRCPTPTGARAASRLPPGGAAPPGCQRVVLRVARAGPREEPPLRRLTLLE